MEAKYNQWRGVQLQIKRGNLQGCLDGEDAARMAVCI